MRLCWKEYSQISIFLFVNDNEEKYLQCHFNELQKTWKFGLLHTLKDKGA